LAALAALAALVVKSCPLPGLPSGPANYEKLKAWFVDIMLRN